jgi:hypothetical protein
VNEDAIYESSALHPLEEPVRVGFWRTTTGEMAISEMTDRHLRNAIAFGERKRLDPEKIDELRAELAKR